jgi:hypothetical protein
MPHSKTVARNWQPGTTCQGLLTASHFTTCKTHAGEHYVAGTHITIWHSMQVLCMAIIFLATQNLGNTYLGAILKALHSCFPLHKLLVSGGRLACCRGKDILPSLHLCAQHMMGIQSFTGQKRHRWNGYRNANRTLRLAYATPLHEHRLSQQCHDNQAAWWARAGVGALTRRLPCPRTAGESQVGASPEAFILLLVQEEDLHGCLQDLH